MAQPKDSSGSGERSAGGGAMRIDSKLVRDLAQLLTDNALTGIEVEDGDGRIKVKREPAAIIGALPAAAATAPALSAPPTHAKEDLGTAEAEEVAGETVKSPMVGTAFLSPEP